MASKKKMLCEMVQMDTSFHDWLEGRGTGKLYLIATIDDATSTLHARFFEADSTLTNMALLKSYSEQYGAPLSFYLDRASHFKVNRKSKAHEDCETEAKAGTTQIQRALSELSVNMIFAGSPQAKGRVERLFRTLQDRLVKMMRVHGINDMDAANEFLEKKFVPNWNKTKTKKPESPENVHRSVKGVDLDGIFCIKIGRTVANDYTFILKKQQYQIAEMSMVQGMRKAKVKLEIRLDCTLKAKFNDKYLYVSPVGPLMDGVEGRNQRMPLLIVPAPRLMKSWNEPKQG
jgi:hypothetical protein